MQKIQKNMYLISGLLFALISVLGFLIGKSPSALIAGLIISLICILFNFIFKPKWSEENKNILLKVFEDIKPVGEKLPISIISKIQIIFLVLMIITLLQPLIISIIPNFPGFILVVINNISFSLLLLSLFYNVLQGNLKSLLKITKLISIYQIFDVIITFIGEGYKVSTRGMCLFLTFWSLNLLLSVLTSDVDPSTLEEEKPKKEKVKKEKKSKKKDNKEEDINKEQESEEKTE